MIQDLHKDSMRVRQVTDAFPVGLSLLRSYRYQTINKAGVHTFDILAHIQHSHLMSQPQDM